MNGDYSAKGLEGFFDYILEKGLMNKETATNWKGASLKVLEILSDHERQDLRSLDKDQVFQRFVNLKGKTYNPSSLNVYKSRFSSALSDFISWNDDPLNFKPGVASKQQRSQSSKTAKPSKPVNKKDAATVQTPASGHTAPDVNRLTLPIPLRPGLVVTVSGIPYDLTADEAKKITAIIEAYAVASGA